MSKENYEDVPTEPIETVEMSAVEMKDELEAPSLPNENNETDASAEEEAVDQDEEGDTQETSIVENESAEVEIEPDLFISAAKERLKNKEELPSDDKTDLEEKAEEVLYSPSSIVVEDSENVIQKSIPKPPSVTTFQKTVTFGLGTLCVLAGTFFFLQYSYVSEKHSDALAYEKEYYAQGDLAEDVSALEGEVSQEENRNKNLTELAKARKDYFNTSLNNAIAIINSAKGEFDVEPQIQRVRQIQDDVVVVETITVEKIKKYGEELNKIESELSKKLEEHLKKKEEDYKKAQAQNSEMAAQLEKEIADAKARLEAEIAEKERKEQERKEKEEQDKKDKEEQEKEEEETKPPKPTPEP